MDPRGKRILILGDSLSAASWAPGGALAAELRKAGAAEVRVDARVGRSAVNLWNGTNGENGATVAAEAARRPDIVVVFLGTNDAASGVSAAADEAGFRRIVAAFAPGTEWYAIGPPAFPKRPDIEARAVPVYATLARVFGPGRVLDARPLTPATGRKSDGVHFTALGGPAFGRALAAALVPAAAPTSTSASAIAPFTVGAWRWALGGATLAALGVGLAYVIRRRRQLAGPEDASTRALAPNIAATMSAAQAALERMGWQLVNVEIDQVKGTARVEVKRNDGRYVTLDTRNGKTTITREQVEVGVYKTGRRGDSALVERLHMRFLGRDRIEGGFRLGMRQLAQYLDDNSTGPQLGRDALRKLLQASTPDDGALRGLAGDDYRMDHRPAEDGPPLHDLLEGDLAPRDIYDQPQWYTGYDGPQLHETVARLRFARGRPERKVWIFRAAPREGGGRFNAGDWVSLSRAYGMNHAKHPTDPAQDMPVYAAQVPASTVRWAGDDLMEFGYWGPPVKGKVSWSRRVRRKAAP